MGCITSLHNRENVAPIHVPIVHKSQNDNAALKVKKILILGTSHCGRSTTLNAIKWNHRHAIDDDHQSLKVHIRINCIKTTLTLLKQSHTIYDEDNAKYSKCDIELNEYLTSAITLLVNVYDSRMAVFDHVYDSVESVDLFDSVDLVQVGEYIEYIWRLEAIQETFRFHRKGSYALTDNTTYFLDKVTEIMDDPYTVTREDYLRYCHQHTFGIMRYEYKIDDGGEQTLYQLFDIGGQRSERKKWIHAFECVTCVICVIGLSDYCKALYEDESTLQLTESLELCDQVFHNKWFRKTHLVLWLNKMDLFRECLQYTPLSICFGDEYKGSNYKEIDIVLVYKVIGRLTGSNSIPLDVIHIIAMYFDLWLELCVKDGLEFIKQKCLSLCSDLDRTVHIFEGSALNPPDIERMMNVVHQFPKENVPSYELEK